MTPVSFAGCRSDYYQLALLAQPHSSLLQRIVFESCKPESRCSEDERLRVSLLVPSSIFARWREAGDGVAPEHMGEQILFLEIMRTCEREGILSMDDLYG